MNYNPQISSGTAAPELVAASFEDRAAPIQDRLVVTVFLGDVVVVAAALLSAFWIRFDTPVATVGIPHPGIEFQGYAGHMIFGGIFLMFMLLNLRVYEPGNLLAFRNTLRLIGKACLIWVGSYLGLSLILKFDPEISRAYCAIAFVCAVFGLFVWRRIFYGLIRGESVASRIRQRAVFVGWGEDCERANRWINDPSAPIRIAGVIRPPSGVLDCEPPRGVRVLGDYSELKEAVLRVGADFVLVTDRDLDRRELHALAQFCEKEMIDFKVVPTCFQVLLSGLHLESLSGMPVLGISRLPLHSAFNHFVKRVFDIVGALIGLILSAPLIAIFGLMVYKESPGPIFYRQRRLGRYGEIFEILKLRSMKLNAEAPGKVGWTVKDDPRRLRIGEFMRKWNIDEVPQFWNVLKGEMSLVGPRPERPELIEQFKEEIPHYNARHACKPGITGWAQVNGLRGDTCLRERIKFDLHYIENWGLLYDFQIMLLTFFNRDNAC